jgi:DNA repair exonuclease SbcCD ATPase subunit
MEFNQITRLEHEIISVLKEEYSFYQSLYILIDKQKDMIKYERDERLLDLFTEIERCHQRIRQSEEKIAALKRKNPKIFKIAAVSPEVKKLVNSIITMVKKNMGLVRENEDYLKSRHHRLKSELKDLQNSHKILRYIRDTSPTPLFVDGKN